ncbi:condensation domain-containing protein [Streptomyces alkaliphilus]|uniref:condensation domain-containing protein n=1 Tax=Streptomyces alkaliphilus TaxID=1472722 RepID=UPI001180F67F|nr:condensation domain-containing protein [Streptomyces alkaliphilus]MQS05658.1 hypothetical protein [Streptomyces alkaliphilus]
MSDNTRYRASPAQADVWLADTLAGDAPPSTMRLAVHAPITLSAAAVAGAARRLADRHAILGSRLVFDEEGLWVHPGSFTVTVDDLSGARDDTPARRAMLGPGEPWHVWLRDPDTAGDGSTVVLAFDHAYVDGESVGILVRDFVADCGRLEAGLPLPPVVAGPDYRHYAREMHRLDRHPDEASASYWRSARLESGHRTTEGARPPGTWPTQRAHLDGAALREVRRWAGTAGVTLFGAVLATAARVVSDCVAGPLVISVPVSQRGDGRFTDTVGLCTELCPLRVEKVPAPFADFAHGLFLDLLRAVDHLLPLAAVRRLRGTAGGTARGDRLDSVTVTMVDAIDGSGGWPVRSMDDDNAGRDLAIVVVQGPDGLTVVARSGHRVFGEAPIADRIVSMLERL